MSRYFKDPKKHKYGYRWMAETVFSVIKRRLTSALAARLPVTRNQQLRLLALTYNIMRVFLNHIFSTEHQRVLLDSDLAELYGVTTKRLNEQVTRNIRRFPADFMFPLLLQELTNLKSQNATSSFLHGGKRKPPRVFTEYGAVMAANVLNSDVAIDASIMIVRVFVKLKEIAHEQSVLKKRLQLLEQKVAKGFAEHADELQEIRFVLAKLEQPPEIRKRKIGF